VPWKIAKRFQEMIAYKPWAQDGCNTVDGLVLQALEPDELDNKAAPE
jgi:hypothetical protein